jgi:hypothetical protein
MNVRFEGVGWIRLSQARVECRAFMNMLIKFMSHKFGNVVIG